MNMSSKSKSDRTSSLLAAIKRQAPTNPAPAPAPEAEATIPVPALTEPPEPRLACRTPASAPAAAKSRAGKPVQFWLHDEDRRVIRELAAWLAGQGERPTDSLVIRSVLATAKTNSDFLNVYRRLSQLDGRLKPRKTA
jgi:hypothetical protein